MRAPAGHWLFLLALVGAPAQSAHAQERAPAAEAEPVPPAEESALRVLTGLGAGVGGAVIGALGGGAVGCIVGAAGWSPGSLFAPCPMGAWFGAVAGAFLAYAPFVWLGSRSDAAEGDVGWTWIGQLIGLGTGVLLFSALAGVGAAVDESSPFAVAGFGLGAISTLAGAHIGAELSHGSTTDARVAPRSAEPLAIRVLAELGAALGGASITALAGAGLGCLVGVVNHIGSLPAEPVCATGAALGAAAGAALTMSAWAWLGHHLTGGQTGLGEALIGQLVGLGVGALLFAMAVRATDAENDGAGFALAAPLAAVPVLAATILALELGPQR